MSNLLLKFELRLESPPIKSGVLYAPGLYGPQFHRWLPDGETDAITLDTKHPNTTLKIWFERRGFVDGNLLKFDYERQEVDPQIMSKQGRLDAGPLIGLLEIRGLSSEEVASLKEKKASDKQYSVLEKKVIKLFYPCVNKFLSILRGQYGQYWIPEIEKWNSHKESASSYLRRFGFPKWSLDGGKTWQIFASPNEVRLSVGALRKQQDFREYITKEEWQEIPSLLQSESEPSLGASVMVEAVELFDHGYIRYAIIDAVTALEIALGESFREQLAKAIEFTFNTEDLPFYIQIAIAASIDDNKPYSRKIEKIKTIFYNLKIPEKFTVMATLLQIPQPDREYTLKIIDIRNRMIHQGEPPSDNIEAEFSGLLNAFMLLLPNRSYRFPLAHAGNRVITPED
jgi:hypothetical protein